MTQRTGSIGRISLLHDGWDQGGQPPFLKLRFLDVSDDLPEIKIGVRYSELLALKFLIERAMEQYHERHLEALKKDPSHGYW